MNEKYATLIAAEGAATMMSVDAELAFLAEAGLIDLAMVADIMGRAVDADPPMAVGIAVLARMVEQGAW